MSLAQENFERALSSGYPSLSMLVEAARSNDALPLLKNVNTQKLRTIAWDLEAIQMAIRMELNERDDRNMQDFG